MLKTFTKGEKKLLKGLKMEYFNFIMMKGTSIKWKFREMEDEEIKEKRRRRREKKEEQKEQDKKPFVPDEYIEWMINREKAPINNDLLKKHF